jgi:FHS family L-fucose permease-like MFS transporter
MQPPVQTQATRRHTPWLPFVLVTSLFLMWGLANNMTDTLLSAFKRILSISDTNTSWIQFVFYGAYFLLALPGALLIRRFTYRTGILLGLGLFIAGSLLFYPASQTMVYGHFLAALFILAAGLSLLETAANPYIVAMGPPETGTQRLNLAQSFNPVGSIIGVELSRRFILSRLNQASAEERATLTPEALQSMQADELTGVMGPYVGVAAVLLLIWLAIALVRMPKASENEQIELLPQLRRLWSRANWRWSVLAQFFYVGAQIGVWSFTIRLVMRELNVMEEEAASYYSYSLYAFLGARFVFTALMRVIKPHQLLGILAIVATGLTLLVVSSSGLLAVWALVAISACMSLMFPTIFGLGLAGLGEDTKLGGAGLIMAILGGAVFPPLMGVVSDSSGSIQLAYVLPMACFALVAFYALVIVPRFARW